MDFNVVEIVQSLGVPIAITGYFLYKDWKLTGDILECLGVLKQYLQRSELVG